MVFRLGLKACLLACSIAEFPQLYPGPGQHLTLHTRTLRPFGIQRSALPFQLDGVQFQLSCNCTLVSQTTMQGPNPDFSKSKIEGNNELKTLQTFPD